jgi:hypothetical protein
MHEEFKFYTSFCCKQEPREVSTNSSGYYVMSLMDDLVYMESLLSDHASLPMWAIDFEKGEQNFLRECERLHHQQRCRKAGQEILHPSREEGGTR